jgi:hypothetical protein
VVTWVHLYQWGDAIDVRGDGRAKRLGTPGIGSVRLGYVSQVRFVYVD